MKRTHVVAAAVGLVLVLLAAWLLFFRGSGGSGGGTTAAKTGTARGTGLASPGVKQPAPDRDAIDAARTRAGAGMDPVGKLLLEGQVLGEDDQPVGGAEVWISTAPPRSVKSEEDGGFSFDKLLPREYTLTARATEGTGGPVMVRVGAKNEPVVIRLREGATLVVRVTSETDGSALAGATVELAEMGKPTQLTGADGRATFQGLGAGWSAMTVRADGFATQSSFTTIGAAGTTQEIGIVMRKGAPLSGTVVDEQGKPVAGAYVQLGESGGAWGMQNDETTTRDDGSWRFASVAAGSYVVSARDAEHAPGSSEILTLDGQRPKEDVTITLGTAAVVRGRVIDKTRAPAAFAQVRVGPKDASNAGDWWNIGEGGKSVTADEQGNFEVRGLPRAKMRIRAENDTAASAITDIDLLSAPVLDGVELMLDVEGVIAGVVVDSKGEPIPEAQVSAFPDIFGGDGAKLDDLAFGGFTATTTDGGGAFRIHGLPEGAYRLWASRTAAAQMMFMTEGTKAKTGDTKVKIVLPAPGGIEGRVAFSDGKIPERAMVQVSVMPSSPVADGAFELRDLPVGSYDLRVRGTDFAELVKRNVEVKPGAVTDIGTIVVKRGRKIAGTVVDPTGKPLAGARVVAGEILFSEGKGGDGNAILEEQMGVRSAVTDEAGAFTIQGAPEKSGSVMAEHASLGRSNAVPFAGGTEDVVGLQLQLRGFGSVSGKVTMEGQPVGNAQVMASSKDSKSHMVMVATGPDGTFVIDKLPEGVHKLSANRMVNFQMSSASREITITAGQRTTADLDFPVGTITLLVEVKGEGGKRIDGAQLFLFRGAVAASNAKEVTERFIDADPSGMIPIWTHGSPPAKFEKKLAGAYTLCTLPINGNMGDMQFQQRLRDHMESLAVYCKALTIAAAPAEQTFTAVVPPMKPLPED
jgi:uncharacterized GH25 family protein